MLVEMKLQDKPFNSIVNGLKTIEMRLYDEKRKLLKVDDIIEFTNMSTQEKIRAKIIGLYVFDNFAQLYNHFDKLSLGYEVNEDANPSDMEQYYSKEEQAKYGVVGIKIKLLN